MSNDNLKKIMLELLMKISDSYPGRFEISRSMPDTWCALLGDLDCKALMVAVHDLCYQSKWPPSVHDIRSRAVEIQKGIISRIGAFEAWERVTRFSRGEKIELTEVEKRVLNFVGGTYQLKNSTNIQMDRNAFVKYYDELIASQTKSEMVSKPVKTFIDTNVKRLT